MEDLDVEELLTRTCTYCGGYSEYPRALCNACMDSHKAKACEELRPMACHACNMIELDEWEG